MKRMATNSPAVKQLGLANLMIGGTALLGWVAVAALAYFHQMPPVDQLRQVSDFKFFVIVLCGPFCLPAGIGLLKRRRWARLMTMGLGVVVGILTITGFALAYFGVLQSSSPGDFFLLVVFAAYSVTVFVILWNETFAGETS